jgi:uncharacterized protein YkwD
LIRARVRTRAVRTAAIAVALVALVAGCRPSSGAPASPSCQPNATTSTIFNLVNGARQASGVPGLRWNGQLGCLAAGWSMNMSNTGQMVHRDLNAVIHLPEYGAFHTLGENILQGPANLSAGSMHNAWMNSAGHRANILSRSFTMIGIGIYYGRGQVWATENFGA